MTSARVPARRVAATILVCAMALTGVGIVAAPPHISASATVTDPRPVPRHVSRPAPATTPTAAPTPAPLVIRHVIDTGGAIRYGSYFWNDEGAATGPLTITVDLKASVLSVFRGGDEIGTTAVIYGNDGKETPLGTFPIMAKDQHHFSKKYKAPMPYMLRLTGDGVSIHASAVAADYATHGCVGVPDGFARKLFAVAKIGDRVIITQRGMVAGGEALKPPVA